MTTGTKVHEQCLICSGQELNPLEDFRHAFLVKCAQCGFVFCERIPQPDELSAHYNHYPQMQNISEVTIKRYEELLDEFEPFRKTNNFLDIGFGDGHLLTVAKRRGWNVFGTEFSETLAAKGTLKGFNVKQGKFDKNWFSKHSFDVITYIEVLEHINSHKEEIPLYINTLRTGGIFYLTTPNFNSTGRRVLKSDWSMVEYPEHLCYYTPVTIKKLFKQFTAVQVKKIVTTGMSLSRLKERTRLKRQETKEFNSYPADEKIRDSIEQSILLRLLKRFVNSILSFTGSGDTIKATFIKRQNNEM